MIWGLVLREKFENWGFFSSSFDEKVFILKLESRFITVIVAVDDMLLLSNDRQILEQFKNRLGATFDVKMFGPITWFIGWRIQSEKYHISIDQEQ